jgi:hypothetical protein
VLAYLSNHLGRPPSAVKHLAEVADTITAACGARDGADPNA